MGREGVVWVRDKKGLARELQLTRCRRRRRRCRRCRRRRRRRRGCTRGCNYPTLKLAV